MKQIYSNLCGRWLIPTCLSLSCLNVFAQKNNPRALPLGFTEQTTYIMHAPVVLPELLQQQKYEEIKNYLANWESSRIPDHVFIFAGKVLVAMETGKFSSLQLPCDCLFYLSDYAKALKDIQGSQFKYHMVLSSRYAYDATVEARKTYLFLQSWARVILHNHQLDSSALNPHQTDSSALFICRVLAGEVPDPKETLKADPASCPRITQLQSELDVYNQKNFMARRDGRRGTASVMVGGWFPTGKLQALGSHPSVGVQLGRRNKLNEYDVTWQFRFLHPTPQEYTFVREDTVHSSHYYDGGYIGFEYTRYIIHKKQVDFGLTSGIAYDYFSVASGFQAGGNEGLGPLNVGSFDFNNGLRLKYFFRRGAFIGLTAKYHLIDYPNKGGTDLAGNAFTLDLSFGSH